MVVEVGVRGWEVVVIVLEVRVVVVGWGWTQFGDI